MDGQSATKTRSPGVVRWLVACDESGVHGSVFYGFGTLWMSWQRRGDFAAGIQELRDKHGCSDELKWQKAGSKKFAKFYCDVVTYFFTRRWLSFHCLVVRRGMVKKDLHENDWDLARRKHFTMLLTNKIRRALKKAPSRDQTFRVWVDPIASRYQKADEAVEVISNNVLARVFGKVRPVDSVHTKDSKETPAIQLCDLLLGAVMDTWNNGASSETKKRLQAHIARHVGWPDLFSDTAPAERKFNIWYFYDKGQGVREVETRRVDLLYPI